MRPRAPRDQTLSAGGTQPVSSLLKRRERVLGPTYQAFYDEPLHLVRGEGVWLYDPSGNAYLDVYNNVASVGHCHPHVVAALARQASMLNTHTRYLNELIIDYGERLLATCPTIDGHALFTCTGSEANDLAIQIAQSATGGSGIIVTEFAYHGSTWLTAELSPEDGGAWKAGIRNRTVKAPDTFTNEGEGAAHFAFYVQAAIDDLHAHGLKPAALLIDLAFSSDGIYFPPPEVLREAAAAIHKAGGLLIADEVQSGLGRLGHAMWGFQRAMLDPDIVTMGKPVGDGHPIGAVIARQDLVRKFARQTKYFNTFGGNAVSAAVGMAVLDVLENEGLVENSRIVGAYLKSALKQLQQKHGLIGDVRGEGLYLGLELIRPDRSMAPATTEAGALMNRLRQRGVLVGCTGPHGNILKLRPPLVFSAANADRLVTAIDEILSKW